MTTGMVIMRPTSIVVAGGGTETASIRAAGGVEFANATSLSLNGVFTSDYDDYMIVCRYSMATEGTEFVARLRASGTDAATSYTYQLLNASSTTISGSRTSTTYARLVSNSTTASGVSVYLYGPNLAQPTAYRTVTVDLLSGPRIHDFAGTHSTASAYDGITIFNNTTVDTSGLVTVYGLAQ